MKTMQRLFPILLIFCTAAHAQVAPAATGPGRLPISGNLQYSINYSQSSILDDNREDTTTGVISASVKYSNSNMRLPFSLIYGGGYNWTEAGLDSWSGPFQNLSLSQVIVWHKWNFAASDDISYRHQAPTTGFSGVAGTGDLTGATTGTATSQSILTVSTHVIENTASGTLGHPLNFATSLNGSVSSSILRYPDGNGLDTSSLTTKAEMTKRLNVRNSLTGSFMFSQYSYPDSYFTLVTYSGYFGFMRMWSRKITTNISAGPQWASSSDLTLAPSSTALSINASVNYRFRFTSANLTYIRETSGGSGYTRGAQTDTAHALLSREFGKHLFFSIDSSYMRTAGLLRNGETNSIFAGVQGTRQFGRHLSMFASYTAVSQSSSLLISPAIYNPTILDSLQHTISFGMGYSPRKTRLKD